MSYKELATTLVRLCEDSEEFANAPVVIRYPCLKYDCKLESNEIGIDEEHKTIEIFY